MNLFIFGSTGDLVRRKVMPALKSLGPQGLQIIALGRKALDHNAYQELIFGDSGLRHFELAPKYHIVEFKPDLVCLDCPAYVSKESENFFYSALPPEFGHEVVCYVGGLKNMGFRVSLLLEKPFGADLKDALKLKKEVIKQGLKDDLYISDHYLFKDGIRKLERASYKMVRIVSLENVGLEKRAGYYDSAGALKDMVQSHFLNIAFRLSNDKSRDLSRIKVLDFERRQYGDGQKNGYAKELGRPSETETFVRLRFSSKGTTYDFITGKAFDKKIGYVQLDGRRMDFSADVEDYKKLFSDFFSKKRENFVTMKDSISAWKIFAKLNEVKPHLKYYKSGASAEGLLKKLN